MPENARPPESVRCYGCRRLQDPRRDACESCGAVFHGLCRCGAQHSLFADACPSCGAPHAPRRPPRSMHPLVRGARWGLAGLVVAAVGAAWWSRQRDLPAWALKERGLEHFRAARYADAARDFDDASRLAPRDAQAWFNLGLARRNLKMTPDAWEPPVRRAVEIDPGMYEARLLLATEARRAGRLEEALAEARVAASLPMASADAHVLVAELTLARAEPDEAAAIDALRRAISLRPDSVEARVLLAECQLRRYGPLPAEAYPPDVAVALEQARAALDTMPAGADAWQRSVLRARVLLASGAAEQAFAVADEAITRPPEGTPDDVVAFLHVVRARALLEWRGDRARPLARESFLAALRMRPDHATAAGIAEDLRRRTDDAFAEEILSAAAAAHDPSGAIATQLAALMLRRGRAADARRTLDGAPRPPSDDPVRVLVDSDVRAAGGDTDGARAGYRDAARLAPGWPVPLVRQAMLAVPAGRPVVRASATAAADELRAATSASGADAGVLVALARLELAAGRPEAAVRDADRGTRQAPGDADAWLVLADAHLATTDPDASTRAALAFARARALRPDDADLARREVETLLRADDPASAVAAATRFLERHPDEPAVLRARARAAMLLEQWRTAAEDYRRLAARPDRSADVLLALARCLHRSGDREAALRALEDARATDPRGAADAVEMLRAEFDGEDAPKLLQRLRARGLSVTLARAELASGEAAAAAVTARRILADAPGDVGATDVLVLAVMDLSPGDAAAREECRRAIAALRPDAPAWLGRYLEARVLGAERRWAEADALLSEIEDSLPQAAVPVFVRGTVAFRAGRRAEGLDLLRRSLRLPGVTAALPPQVAAALFEGSGDSKDMRRVESLLRECLTLDPDHPQAAMRLSLLFAVRGEFAASAAVAERGLQSPRASAADLRALRLHAAGAHVAAGNAALANAHVDVLAGADPASPEVMLLRGFAHAAEGRLEEAAQALTDARRAAPASPWPVLGLVRVALARDDVAGARSLVEAWGAERPADLVLPLAAADEFQAAGRPVDAAAVLAAVARAQPSRADVAARCVDLLAAAGRTADAVAAAREFRERADAVVAREADLVIVRALTADAPTADEGLRAARSLAADAGLRPELRRDARLLEARALLLTGSVREARDAATAVLTSAGDPPPGDVEFSACDTRGLAASVLGDWRAAAADLRRCVALRPRDPRTLNNAAWALAQVPEFASEALGLARRATSIRPSDPNYWATRAVAAEAAGESDDAASSYAECLRRHELAPGSDPAGRGRNAVRFARLLRSEGREERAAEVARSVAGFRPAPPAEVLRDAEAFLRP